MILPFPQSPNQAMKIISTLTPVSHNISTASPIGTPVTVKSLLSNAKQKKSMTTSSQKSNEEAVTSVSVSKHFYSVCRVSHGILNL